VNCTAGCAALFECRGKLCRLARCERHVADHRHAPAFAAFGFETDRHHRSAARRPRRCAGGDVSFPAHAPGDWLAAAAADFATRGGKDESILKRRLSGHGNPGTNESG
jgi:hypothetical protein